ncbi:MAG TPA: YhbY family RNA-binding protein [Casimicrobiaceae bacterium]|nr:YhbY family RNA-binding protein [Casimicrobiaceae bacterium]
MDDLTPQQRRALRAKAHHLHAVVSIGQHGLTPQVLHEIDVALTAHGLVKIRVHSDDRDARDAMLADIATQLHAAPVQHLGKLLIVWRERDEDEAEPPRPAKAATKPRTTARAHRTGTKAPQVQAPAPARAPKPVDAGRIPRGTPPARRRRAAGATTAASGGPPRGGDQASGARRRGSGTVKGAAPPGVRAKTFKTKGAAAGKATGARRTAATPRPASSASSVAAPGARRRRSRA